MQIYSNFTFNRRILPSIYFAKATPTPYQIMTDLDMQTMIAKKNNTPLSDASIEFDDAPQLTVRATTLNHVQGVGLFAKQAIPKGSVVIDFSDIQAYFLYPLRSLLNHCPEFAKTNKFIALQDEDKHVLIPKSIVKLDALNHSTPGNIKIDYERQAFVATNPIRANEEIFFDYRSEYEPPLLKERINDVAPFATCGSQRQ